MIRTDTRGVRAAREIICHALIILPAVLLGVLAMIRSGVSPALWGQQLAAFAVFALLIWPLQRVFRRIPAALWSALLLIPLAAALFGEEAGGARRWMDLVVFHANAAMLVLPALLVVLCHVKCPYPALLGAAVLLCMQPSLAQLIAFAAASLPILWQQKKKLWGLGSVLALAALIVWAGCVPVTLEPEAYCEGILALLGDGSWLLQGVGWLALAAVSAFWLLRFWRKGETQMLSVSIYYAAAALFSLTGKEPVLLMGFGLSPIVGYCLACAGGLAFAQEETQV